MCRPVHENKNRRAPVRTCVRLTHQWPGVTLGRKVEMRKLWMHSGLRQSLLRQPVAPLVCHVEAEKAHYGMTFVGRG
jgi:hypothetical protein